MFLVEFIQCQRRVLQVTSFVPVIVGIISSPGNLILQGFAFSVETGFQHLVDFVLRLAVDVFWRRRDFDLLRFFITPSNALICSLACLDR